MLLFTFRGESIARIGLVDRLNTAEQTGPPHSNVVGMKSHSDVATLRIRASFKQQGTRGLE